jgi:co-chaperonin GroES (HSP10)
MPAALKAKQNDPSEDQKREILKKLGDVSEFEIAQNEVLLVIYQRPEMTAGGIVITHQTQKEDIYQGKVGLVVKIGEHCQFDRIDPYTNVKTGIPIELHDWVVVRPSDTWALDVNMHSDTLSKKDFMPCRLVHDKDIRAKIPHPMVIW